MTWFTPSSVVTYLPKLATALPPLAAVLRRMLMTPAIASDPYCDEAPSRSTSIRSIASAGIEFRSTAAEPRPIVPLMLSSAAVCRRLPLTSTSVWSGDSPRRVAGRNASEPSAMAGWGKLKLGTSLLRILLVSTWPPSVSISPDRTSTGTGELATVRVVEREPVTMIVLSGGAVSAAAVVSWANAGLAPSVRAIAPAAAPVARMLRRFMALCSLFGAT